MEGTLVWFIFLLTIVLTGQAQQTVITRPGEDAVLPCRLTPPTDASGQTLEWARPDLHPRFVYVWHKGLQILTDQNAYKGRAAVSVDRLKLGDASLTLLHVRTSDSGRYRCYFPETDQEFLVDLVVGAVSRPEVTLVGMDRSTGAVLLRCRSAGWYPEPELLWLDAQGNPIPAGPSETLRGPDGLYTVSGGASVEKRRGNTFTCRVRQSHINQSRETQQHLPDQFFIPESSCAAPIAVGVVASILLVLVLVTINIRTQRQKYQQEKKTPGGAESQPLKGNNAPREEDKETSPEEVKKMENKVKEMIKLMKEFSNKLQDLRKDPTGVDTLIKEVEDDLSKTAPDVSETAPDVSKTAPDVSKTAPDVSKTAL